MSRSCSVIAVTVLLALSIPPAGASTWYVFQSGAGTKDGRSWANAFATVTEGLAAAAYGDTVNVAWGEYHERVTVPAGVSLQGSWYEYDTGTHEWRQSTGGTTLYGDEGGSVVTVQPGASINTIIACLGISRGTGTLVDGRTRGGGIYVRNARPQLVNLRIFENQADIGGGIYVENGRAWIADNVIMYNHAVRQGGGIYVSGSSPEIVGNRIYANSAGTAAGIYAATTVGESTRVCNNQLIDNRGLNGSGGMVLGTSVKAVNNTILRTRGTSGAVFCLDGAAGTVVANNLVAGNNAGVTVGVSATVDLHHNDVFDNAAGNYAGVADPTGRDGNISKDPMLLYYLYGQDQSGVSKFVAENEMGDLPFCSPCADAGDDAAIGEIGLDLRGEPRVMGVGVDIGAFEAFPDIPPRKPIHVRPGGNDAKDGLTWETARASIGAGINAAAAAGNEVWVAAGTYSNLSVEVPANISVFGGFAGTETRRNQRNPDAHPSILQAGGPPAIILNGNLAWIDGFTIRGGIGETQDAADRGGGIRCVTGMSLITNNIIENGNVTRSFYGPGMGGGIHVKDCPPVIAGNLVRNNKAGLGGGIYCEGDEALIAFNVLQGNTATNSSGRSGGGGIYTSGNTTVQRNTILENEAVNSGGGVDVHGGEPVIEQNTIRSNKAGFTGAGIHAEIGAPHITLNLIEGNDATSPTHSAGMGGGLCLYDAAPSEVFSNVIRGNRANHASGIYLYRQGSRVESNVVADNVNTVGSSMVYLRESSSQLIGNTVVDGEGIHVTGPASVTLANNIIAYNRAGVTVPAGDSATVALSHNCLFGNVQHNYSGVGPGSGDIFVNPAFGDRASGDFHLTTLSPCVNAGGISLPYQNRLDADGAWRRMDESPDIGAYELQYAKDVTLVDVTCALRVTAGLDAVPTTTAFVILDAETSGTSSRCINTADAIRLLRTITGLSPRVLRRIVN